MVKKSQPNPAPENRYARRLRSVREEHGEDIKTFHGRVKKAGKLEVSYAAARHYDFDRVAPPEYFVAVAMEYGVRLDWLLTGEGPRTVREARATGAITAEEESFWTAWEALGRAQERIRAPFRPGELTPLNREAWNRLVIGFLDGGPDLRFEDYDEDQMVHALEPLAWVLALPLLVFSPQARANLQSGADLGSVGLPDDYFMAMYQALNLAIPKEGKGDAEYSTRFLRSVQEVFTEGLEADEGEGDQ